MKRQYYAALLAVLCFTGVSSYAGPRDAAAVLNRCGAPTLGDTTIYEAHTLSGGRRIFKYIRGTVNFNRVQNDGWTFTFGSHGKEENLTAEEMDKYMPCLTAALADSASAGPIRPITESARVEASMKHEYKLLILGTLGVLLLLVVAYFITRTKEEEEDDE